MYAKTVTRKIVELQAKGFSGEETRDYLQEYYQIHPCLDTIYRHRKSPIGIEMLYELIRQQERDILKCEEAERETAMRYRDKLIGQLMDKLLPSLSQIEAKTEITERLEARIEIDATENEETILNKAASILARKERTSKIH